MTNWIQTYTGKKFDLDNPTVDMIDIEDIATGLANTCRFAGQCAFYSVAQHSVYCFDMAIKEYKNPRLAKYMLFHDAGEAYLGDIPRPLKKILPEYKVIELRVQSIIEQKFKTDELTFDEINLVKEIDNRMLFTERKYLLSKTPDRWIDEDKYPVYDIKLEAYEPYKAKQQFLYYVKNKGI